VNCNDAREMISAYLDGELDERSTTQLMAHIEACRDCAQLLHDLAAVIHGVTDAPKFETPAALNKALVAQIEREMLYTGTEGDTGTATNWRRWTVRGVVAAAIVVLAFGAIQIIQHGARPGEKGLWDTLEEKRAQRDRDADQLLARAEKPKVVEKAETVAKPESEERRSPGLDDKRVAVDRLTGGKDTAVAEPPAKRVPKSVTVAEAKAGKEQTRKADLPGAGGAEAVAAPAPAPEKAPPSAGVALHRKPGKTDLRLPEKAQPMPSYGAKQKMGLAKREKLRDEERLHSAPLGRRFRAQAKGAGRKEMAVGRPTGLVMATASSRPSASKPADGVTNEMDGRRNAMERLLDGEIGAARELGLLARSESVWMPDEATEEGKGRAIPASTYYEVPVNLLRTARAQAPRGAVVLAVGPEAALNAQQLLLARLGTPGKVRALPGGGTAWEYDEVALERVRELADVVLGRKAASAPASAPAPKRAVRGLPSGGARIFVVVFRPLENREEAK